MTPTEPLPASGKRIQDLSRFRVPPGFRGRSLLTIQLWHIVAGTLFRFSPRRAWGWRRALLRLFGAQVGKGVHVLPSARVTYPWFVRIGDHAWVGEDVTLYSFAMIEVGEHAVISQRSYICAGSHDYRDPAFAITASPIVIGPESWVATDVFVGPGVTVGRGAVVGARSCVMSDVPEMMVAVGNPCRVLKRRETAG